jgi:hypothetical protein
MIYINNVAGGFCFGLGLIFAAFCMKVLFHMTLLNG